MEEESSANHATDREAALRDLLLKRSAEPTPSTGDARAQLVRRHVHVRHQRQRPVPVVQLRLQLLDVRRVSSKDCALIAQDLGFGFCFLCTQSE